MHSGLRDTYAQWVQRRNLNIKAFRSKSIEWSSVNEIPNIRSFLWYQEVEWIANQFQIGNKQCSIEKFSAKGIQHSVASWNAISKGCHNTTATWKC